VDIPGARQATALPEPFAEPQPFVENSGDSQSNESEPRKCGQPEEPYQQANRNEDHDANDERGQEHARRRPELEHDETRGDEGEAEDRRPDRKPEALLVP
jgi:hypothetical protein